uniref:PABS domain-containing protein n=1 Tax=Timema douglasi TaxID=61478 RepID=A0A7R8Z722_TIMDO|nr:unnamed protein product [Timema douglasi]
MSGNTIMMDFKVNPIELTDLDRRSKLKLHLKCVLETYIGMLQSAYETRMEDGFLEILKGKNNLLVSLRGYPQGLFCINIEYYKNDDEESRLTFEERGKTSREKTTLTRPIWDLNPDLSVVSSMICTLQDTERVTFQFEQWVSTPAQNKLRSIRDGVSRWPSSIRKSRREEVIVTRLRVGHTSLTHGFLLKGDPPPVCEFCDAPLSVYHILVECRKLAPIRLALDFNDERLLEYDIDKVVYEQRSQFQKILIVHSRSLGNLLLLDDLQNLSESDLIYTETLMQRGKENYQGKEIVILGGGDGALLHELLKEEPKYIVMIEIDELVMKAAAKYLRSCCGDVLDTLKGDNYEIVVDDCVNVLNTYIQQGKSFDYIFGDLTDIPISSNPQGETWDFIRSILSLSMEVLKPEGKYMTHGNGASCPDSLKMFERQLTSLKVPVEFSKCKAFVPSFMEDWVFYQIWKKNY